MNKEKISANNINVHYGDKQALFDINMKMNEKEVTALIGPSGCGKSTFQKFYKYRSHRSFYLYI